MAGLAFLRFAASCVSHGLGQLWCNTRFADGCTRIADCSPLRPRSRLDSSFCDEASRCQQSADLSVPCSQNTTCLLSQTLGRKSEQPPLLLEPLTTSSGSPVDFQYTFTRLQQDVRYQIYHHQCRGQHAQKLSFELSTLCEPE